MWREWSIDVSDDVCAAVFVKALKTWRMDIRGRVLEIGCAEFDWMTPAKQVDPSLDLVGIDWREREGAIQGDVMTAHFDEASFDWIVSISAIEHIGLGHYANDPKAEDGDTRTMRNIARWLKPGGSVYFDVPYTPEGYEVCGTSERRYDEAAITSRLLMPGLVKYRQGVASFTGEKFPQTPPTKNAGGPYPWASVNWWMKT